MSRSRARRPSRRRAPPPAEASRSLVAHDLKNLSARLALLCRNLASHFEDPLFRESAMSLLDETSRSLKDLAVELRERDGRLIVKLPVRIDEILAAAVAERRPDLPEGVALGMDIEAVDPIYGDAFLLRKAFACAVENALDAVEAGGSVSVRCRQRGAVRPRIAVEIADTGKGMSPEFVRDRLFRPFATTKDAGLGLGAYTIRQVTAFHGGRVTIDSAEGRGTRLRFSFPAGELA